MTKETTFTIIQIFPWDNDRLIADIELSNGGVAEVGKEEMIGNTGLWVYEVNEDDLLVSNKMGEGENTVKINLGDAYTVSEVLKLIEEGGNTG